MLVVLHLRADDAAFLAEARAVVDVLAARPGCRRARLGRGLDDPSAWVLLTEWESVGAYRRALSSYDVKVAATAVLSRAGDVGGGFEELYDAVTGEAASDRAPDADVTGPGR